MRTKKGNLEACREDSSPQSTRRGEGSVEAPQKAPGLCTVLCRGPMRTSYSTQGTLRARFVAASRADFSRRLFRRRGYAEWLDYFPSVFLLTNDCILAAENDTAEYPHWWKGEDIPQFRGYSLARPPMEAEDRNWCDALTSCRKSE
eukprot:scaffold3457_cov230-Pinguiococcus_pyrenoidosus.AAC.2